MTFCTRSYDESLIAIFSYHLPFSSYIKRHISRDTLYIIDIHIYVYYIHIYACTYACTHIRIHQLFSSFISFVICLFIYFYNFHPSIINSLVLSAIVARTLHYNRFDLILICFFSTQLSASVFFLLFLFPLNDTRAADRRNFARGYTVVPWLE